MWGGAKQGVARPSLIPLRAHTHTLPGPHTHTHTHRFKFPRAESSPLPTLSGEQGILVEASVKSKASGSLLAARQVALIVERVNEDGKGPASHTFLLTSKSIGRYEVSMVCPTSCSWLNAMVPGCRLLATPSYTA